MICKFATVRSQCNCRCSPVGPMAPVRAGRSVRREWMSLIVFLMLAVGGKAQNDQDPVIPGASDLDPVATTTDLSVQAVSCSEIHNQAFGYQATKPGVCYLAAEEKGVFLDARAYCQGLNDSLGWDVADIEDEVENKLIQDSLGTLMANGQLSSSADTFWIGQNDLKTENTWRYLNESSNRCNRSVYLNWKSNQPNGGLRQNCMAYFYSDGGNFQDRSCDDPTYYYLCKVKITSDTVPSCPDFVEETSTEAPDDCLGIWPVAFSNPSVPGVCYAHESYQKFNFEGALSFCSNLPGGSWSVVDIEDAEENLFLEAWNRDNFPKNNGYWIGQNDREQEDDWRYISSGQCPVYLNWENGQPNGDRLQNCMVMFKRPRGEFEDKDCSETYYSLCKLKKELGPTQSSTRNCDGATLPPEVAECETLHPDAFGSAGNPGACYLMTGQQKTWEEAVAYCQDKGWELMDIENANENDILAARFRDFRPLNFNYWVGQNDRDVEGVWKYASNDTPSDAGVYLNWGSGQPNDNGEQDCIMMGKSGTWEDKECSDYYYVTCKKRVEQTPTTAAPWTDPCQRYNENAFGDEGKPGVCYALTNQRVTWEEAQKVCQEYGAGWNIPDIEDDADLLALVTVNSRLFGSNDGYWIGQNDQVSEGTWAYLDPELTGPVYERWDSSGTNQPDGGLSENCAVFQQSRSGKFKDVVCESQYFVSCKNRNAYTLGTSEVNAVTTPKPKTDASTNRYQTTEGATTPSRIGTTPTPPTTAARSQPTIEGVTQEPSSVSGPVTGFGRFAFRSSDATCSNVTTLYTSAAEDRIHCARKCLVQGNCRSFSFAASGKEDACELCSEVLDAESLRFKTGSVYYFEVQ
ncbi:macrophage mannose receptor 1-like [Acanthaster planci]|uniref:Macrophage mannose receptor 1-like n=1 Tax=Acanthaster planci TaxID=133434 RepID=A0A8B7XLJ1_ACAPL|nr:macrophage mannose receptor 1-like [Acanthaster planci]